MKKTETDLLHAYLLNNEMYLREEMEEVKKKLRGKIFDEVDSLEYIIAKAKYDCFRKTSKEIRHLLKFGSC